MQMTISALGFAQRLVPTVEILITEKRDEHIWNVHPSIYNKMTGDGGLNHRRRKQEHFELHFKLRDV